LYLEHFQLDKPPFEQEPDIDLVFPASGRTAALKNLLADIESDMPLVKLIGSEGTGKTLLCRLLEQSLDHEKYQLVTLEYPVGSYENLLRTICLALGIAEQEGEDEDLPPPNFVELFRQYLQELQTQGKNLVLLIDEAENIFLATLERLIRLLCDHEIRNLQIVLSGRPDLEIHLDQLAVYCSGVEMQEGYILEPLSQEETKQYMYFRLNEAGIPGDKYSEAFSEEALEAIYLSAMGNISLTNSLAELGLKRATEEG
jgi:type II secretory pathway predicted ATPase ExeA